jgi:hypothetical protein
MRPASKERDIGVIGNGKTLVEANELIQQTEHFPTDDFADRFSADQTGLGSGRIASV